MEDYIGRMVREKLLLERNVKGLKKFIEGEVFKDIPEIKQTLMKIQLIHMQAYLAVLKERINVELK